MCLEQQESGRWWWRIRFAVFLHRGWVRYRVSSWCIAAAFCDFFFFGCISGICVIPSCAVGCIHLPRKSNDINRSTARLSLSRSFLLPEESLRNSSRDLGIALERWQPLTDGMTLDWDSTMTSWEKSVIKWICLQCLVNLFNWLQNVKRQRLLTLFLLLLLILLLLLHKKEDDCRFRIRPTTVSHILLLPSSLSWTRYLSSFFSVCWQRSLSPSVIFRACVCTCNHGPPPPSHLLPSACIRTTYFSGRGRPIVPRKKWGYVVGEIKSGPPTLF